MDKFSVKVLSATSNPQTLVYAAMHQDYSSEFVDSLDKMPSESRCGEIAVERLLAGGRGHYGCYSADTEVLTSEGWVRWDAVTKEHRLLAVDPLSCKGRWEYPSALQVQDFDAQYHKMYRMSNTDVDLLVTEDHRLIAQHRKSSTRVDSPSLVGSISRSWNNLAPIKPAEVFGKVTRYRTSCQLSDNSGLLTDTSQMPANITRITALKFAGFYFANEIKHKKPENFHHTAGRIFVQIKYVANLSYLLSLGIPISKLLEFEDVYEVHHKELAQWLHDFFVETSNSFEVKKILPTWILGMNSPCRKAFYEGFRSGESSKVKRKYVQINHEDKATLDTLQALFHLSDMSASISKPHISSRDNPDMKWEFKVFQSVYSIFEPKNSLSTEEYVHMPLGTKVYCATVSTGALLVRRNDKVVVCGNCLEHPAITFACGYFPHSVMQQARTHRVGLCLSGDTEIYFKLASGGIEKQKLSDLHRSWTFGRPHQSTSVDAAYQQTRIKKRKVYCLNEDTLEFQTTSIVDIFSSGEKEVFLIKTSDGKEIKVSANHRFFTNQGWLAVNQFNAETLLTTREFAFASRKEPMSQVYSEEELVNEQWMPLRKNNLYEVSNLGRVRSWCINGHKGKSKQPRLKTLSKSNYLFYSIVGDERRNIHTDVLETFRGEKPSQEYVCRHLDGNHYNNKLENLAWGTEVENRTDQGEHIGFNKFVAKSVSIVSITPVGLEQTYDIEVEAPYHNFLANDLVVHNSFDVQSYRYTSDQLKDVLLGTKSVEDVFYLRPVGTYVDRSGTKYRYSEEWRARDLEVCLEATKRYCDDILNGMSEEHARGKIPFDYRQHFIVSFNLRSFMHFCDLRYKADAQLEIQMLTGMMWEHVLAWCPEIAGWYERNRLRKAKLAP